MIERDEDDEPFTLEPEQLQAARTLDRNVSVEAGAGTGKTTTLTDRYMTILRAHLDGPDRLHAETETTDTDVPYRFPEDIERITDPDEARRLPERILVTTFTERGAEDLKRKVRAEIRSHLDTVDDPDRWRLWRAAADGVEAGYVHTIHGFCNRLLEEYAIDHPTVDPKFDVLEEDDAGLLVRTIVEELLEEEPPKLKRLAPLYERGKLVDILTGLVTERAMAERWIELQLGFEDRIAYEAFLVALHPFEDNPQELLEEVRTPVASLCDLLAEEYVQEGVGANTMKYIGEDLLSVGDQLLTQDLDTYTPLERLTLCLDLCDALTNGDGEAYGEATYFGKKGFRTASGEREAQYAECMEQVLEVVQPASRPLGADITADLDSYECLNALASLARTAIERYDQRKRTRGACDYDDLIRFTIEFLHDTDDETLDRVRSNFWYVMVDEFQDTNTRQWELVRALVSEGDVFNAENVFVVGDTKQSIYRFRDADVTIFSTATEEMNDANQQAGTVDDGDPLKTNFRTLPDTLRAINGLFEAVFDSGPDNPFEAVSGPLREGRTNDDGVEPITEYIPILVESELRERYLGPDHSLCELPDSDPTDIEATAIANRLTALFTDGTHVYPNDDADEDEPRPVKPDDVAILIRSRSALKDYERALRDASIPYTVVKGEGFYETPEIRALLSLFRALVNPDDEVALYGALRSPLCGLSDPTIASVHERGTPLWQSLQNAPSDEVQSVVTDLERWRTYAGTATDVSAPTVENWGTFIDAILKETGYLTAVAADERGTAAVANIDKFREKLREFDASGVPSLERVVYRLNQQAEQGRTEAEANAAVEGTGVRIMTIHESKGQEFPVVVVPGIGKGFNDKARISNGSIEFESLTVDELADLDVAVTGDERLPLLGLKAPGEWGEDDRSTVLRRLVRNRRRTEEHAEEKRILYVACTRARDHLILTGQHKADEDSPTGIEDADPTDPGSWRDWVQPALFAAEETAATWETLELTGSDVAELPYELDGESRTGSVTVRLPPEAEGYDEDTRAIEPQTERTPYQYEQPWEIRLSPSALSRLASGAAELEIDRELKLVRSAQVNPTGSYGERTTADTETEATIFGKAVHKLCEMRPPREKWKAVIDQVIEEEQSQPKDRSPAELPTREIEQIETAAAYAISYIEQLHENVNAVQVHDEFPFELTIPSGKVTGFIDHLVVTDDAYYIIDYKTDRIGAGEPRQEFLKRQAAHHEPQVLAYAAGLQEADPDRAVYVDLFFTDINKSYRWDPSETEQAYAETVDQIQDALPEDIRMKIEGGI